MIEFLIKIGISENTILSMFDMNPDIKDLTEKEIENKINILYNINCNNEQIINIITSNPIYFNTSDSDNKNLINYLLELGISDLNLLLEANPYILSKEVYEVKDYINSHLINNDIEEIINELIDNPLLFNEM